MASRRPRLLFGEPDDLVRVMEATSGLSLGEVAVGRERSVGTAPVLHMERAAVDAGTPSAVTTIETRILLSTATMEAALKAIAQLWDAIGTDSHPLWIVGDDETDVLVTSNDETAGAGRVVEYAAPAKTWFAANDYVFLPSRGASSDDEVVVATAKDDGAPSFTATLAYPHTSGATCYRVAMCYPDTALRGIARSALPLGKGSLQLTWISGGVPLYGTSLPS